MNTTTLAYDLAALPPPYAPRAIRFLGIWHLNGWQLKVYGINPDLPSPGSDVVSGEFIAAAKVLVEQQIGAEFDSGLSPRVGFVVLHEGKFARWLLLDLWYDWILLRHDLFRADQGAGLEFTQVRDGLCACTWELRVIAFEREVWLKKILDHPGGPDVVGYLRTCLSEDS